MQLFIAAVVILVCAVITIHAIPRVTRPSQLVVFGLSSVGAASVAHYIYTSIAGLL